MLIFDNKKSIQDYLKHTTSSDNIGFVPTMGALHEGHLSLIKTSLSENVITVVSIFVNPTQFNNPEDLAKYPRTFDADVAKIKTVSDKIILFSPSSESIYDGKIVSEKHSYDGLENFMEGKFRPGHFDGVGTIVKLLLEIIQPKNAYFGEKDFQQLQIVRKLVSKNKLPVNIIGCPIFREKNGLAMSSRNERLTKTQRLEAGFINEMLLTAKLNFKTKTVKEVTDFVFKTLKKHPTFELEYFEIANENTLKTCVRKHKNQPYRAFIAIFADKVRLIDTIKLS